MLTSLESARAVRRKRACVATRGRRAWAARTEPAARLSVRPAVRYNAALGVEAETHSNGLPLVYKPWSDDSADASLHCPSPTIASCPKRLSAAADAAHYFRPGRVRDRIGYPAAATTSRQI
jgi:hypothetical protein